MSKHSKMELVEELRADALTAAHRVGERVEHGLAAASKVVHETAEDAQEIAGDLYRKAEKARKSARRVIREHPFAVVAAGVLAGAVIGAVAAPRK